MWSAKIESKNFSKGILQIGVSYTNGMETFNESYKIYSLDDINNIIASKLEQIKNTEALEISIGDYSPKPIIKTVIDPKQEALDNLRRTKELVELDVLNEDDKEVMDAIQAVKELI